MFKNKKELIFLFWVVFLIFLDQITKFYFTNQKYFQIIGDYLYLEFHKNNGSAFGIFSNIIYYNYFIILLSFIFIIYLIIKKKYFFQNKNYFLIYIFLISGILGNLIDRIIFEYVRDFIGIKYFSIFNFADIYLTLVVILFLYYELKNLK